PPPDIPEMIGQSRTDPSFANQLDVEVTGPINISLTQDPRMAFETLAEIAGLNVVFDPDFRGAPVPLVLNNVNIFEALDLLALQARAFWQPLNRNTILVAPDNQTKRRE